MEAPVEATSTTESEHSPSSNSATGTPWTDEELELLTAAEDQELAEARAREARGLEPYENLITAEDLLARATELRAIQDPTS